MNDERFDGGVNFVEGGSARIYPVFILFRISIAVQPFTGAIPLSRVSRRSQKVCLSGVEDEDQSGSEEGFCVAIKVFCPPLG